MRFQQKIYCKYMFSADLARNLLYIWSRNKLTRIDYTSIAKSISVFKLEVTIMTSNFKKLALNGTVPVQHEDRDDMAYLAIRIVFYGAAAVLVMSLVLFSILALA